MQIVRDPRVRGEGLKQQLLATDQGGRARTTRGWGGRGIIRTDFPPRDSLIASRTTVTRDHSVR